LLGSILAHNINTNFGEYIMKNTTKNLAVIIASGLLLSGCENSDFAATPCIIDPENTQPDTLDCTSPQGAIISAPNPAPAPEVDLSLGLTGQVFDNSYWVSAQVCFDNNQNAICDTELETTVLTNEQGLYAFTKNATYAGLLNGSPLIATLENRLMTASPDTDTQSSNNSNITPFTSIVVNEMLFSQASFQDAELARQAIAEKDFILASPELLTGNNYLTSDNNTGNSNTGDINNFIASFNAVQAAFNQSLEPMYNYSVIAATFNAMIDNKNFNITVNSDISQADIDALSLLNSHINTQLSTELITWELDYKDETSRRLSSLNGLAIVGSKWHNRLTLLDTSNDSDNEGSGAEPSWISSTIFAYVEGGQDAVDAFSGATEQLLQDIDISPDNRSVFVTVKKAKNSSKDIGVGLYRADIFSPQEIEEIKFASATENTVDYYAFTDINNTALSADGKVLALASEKREIAILNADTLAEQSILELDSKVRSIALNQSGEQVFAGLSKSSRTGIISINVGTKEENDFIARDSYPTDLQLFGNNLLAVSFYQDATLSIFDVSDANNLIAIKNLSASEEIISFSLSNNGKFAAIAMRSGEFELFELTPSIRLLGKFDSKDSANINDISFSDDNTVLISIDNAIQVLTINIEEAL
jgi:WD40 repeat protein